jgi:membrane-bound lytic murein transglycosylase D
LPGIKFAGVRLPRTPHRLLHLAMLAAFISHPAVAEDSYVAVEMLEWRSDSDADDGPANEAAAVAGHDDVWQRIRDGFRIEDRAAQNRLVGVHESWFAARPDNVRRLAERARPYLYHIVEELDRRAMPMEIALLPMIESAFKPTALSPAAASGIWQFIPSTGRHYGLRQDSWYDGRRDFTAATRAALDYLGKLYLDFGDWQLALAAYNCGEGCVARAIQHNVQQGLPTDYASLSLPHETRHYVPKLLALKTLVLTPEQYGVAIEPLPNQPYFNEVTVHASMDLHSAARLANMSSDEFAALNAAFPRMLIRSDTPVNLLVPVDKTDKFQRNLESGDWDTWQPYAAKKGERATTIAERHGISLARLAEHNQLHLKKGKLVRAQTILVPVKSRDAIRAPGPTPAPVPVRHEVQRGETLFGIAGRYGLTVAALLQHNPELNDGLRAGQVLRLRADEAIVRKPEAILTASPKAAPANPAGPRRYTVRRGDTLSTIAERFGASVADIRAWNPANRKSSTIRVGQTLVVGRP